MRRAAQPAGLATVCGHQIGAALNPPPRFEPPVFALSPTIDLYCTALRSFQTHDVLRNPKTAIATGLRPLVKCPRPIKTRGHLVSYSCIDGPTIRRCRAGLWHISFKSITTSTLVRVKRYITAFVEYDTIYKRKCILPLITLRDPLLYTHTTSNTTSCTRGPIAHTAIIVYMNSLYAIIGPCMLC